MFGPSGVDGGWLWSDSVPWSCVVRRVRRSVLVSPSPLILRNRGTGCGSRRFRWRSRLRMALIPVVPTYSRGLGGIVAIQYVCCSKAWLCLSFPWSVYNGTCLVGQGTVFECNRSRGTTERATLTHVPRHHKSRPRLEQGLEVRVGTHARKRHVSTEGAWADLGLMCTWCPVDVMCDLSIHECRSELDMCPCCRRALTAGSVVRVRSPCWSPLSCIFFL